MKKLRHRLIFIVFLSVTGVFLAVALIIYCALSFYNRYQADGMTQIISLSGGVVPNAQDFVARNYPGISQYIEIDEESEFQTRYFIVYYNSAGTAVNVNLEHIAAVSRESALELGDEVLDRRRSVGYVGQYRYRVTQDESAPYAVFLDCSVSFASLRTVMVILSLTAALIILLVTLVFAVCSKRVVHPFEENNQLQKQFITNASHELKTPLAIISANAEVLQYKNGGDNWTNTIIDQAKRMSEMIGNLLTLSKMEEVQENMVFEAVPFGELVEATVVGFQEVLEQKHATIEEDIKPDLQVRGNAEQLKQLVSILMENASKYVSEGGQVEVSVREERRRVALRVSNTAELDESLDCTRLFDRFYRPDAARTSGSGGQGIGLSIAKKIVEAHGGNIRAEKTSDGICFVCELGKWHGK